MKCYYVLLLLFITSCASQPSKPADSKPTPFVQNKLPALGYDYFIDKNNPNLGIALFMGNSNTKDDDAKNFSQLAAYKYCNDRNSATQIFETKKPVDDSINPIFQSSFVCVDKALFIEGVSNGEDLSRELVNPYTNDFKGGVLVKKDAAPLKNNDVIISLNNVRIEKMDDVITLVEKLKSKNVSAKIIRSGKPQIVKLKIVDKYPLLKSSSLMMTKLLCVGLYGNRPAYCEPFLRTE
jgi:hypothetical protein